MSAPSEKIQQVITGPTSRTFSMEQRPGGKWFFRHAERFDILEGEARDQLLERTADALRTVIDGLIEGGQVDEEGALVFKQDGVVGYEVLASKNVISNMMAFEMLPESDLGQLKIADIFAMLAAMAAGGVAKAAVRWVSPEEVTEKIKLGQFKVPLEENKE